MKSYSIIYKGNISNALNNIGITQYMILNDQLAIMYTTDDFEENILNGINEIPWYKESEAMSSMIEIGNNIEGGETVTIASGINFVENNPYINISGRGVIIGILDSGINYMHPDFINDDNTSKIISIWDQDSNKKQPPEGMLFGSEFNRDEINEAIINNDQSLTTDNIGTGTIAAGIACGNGRLNSQYRGVATNSELIVVKLKQYEGTFKDGKINYSNVDFLAGIKYILDIAKREGKLLIINLSIGERSRSIIITTLLETFQEFTTSGVILVSGAGNEGNTDIHYQGGVEPETIQQDIILEVGELNSLDITICPNGPGRGGVLVISPSGELSYRVDYSPDESVYKGEFNLEDTKYEITFNYPWLLSGNQEILVRIIDIKPGIWTIRIFPEFSTTGEFDMYLPNRNIIDRDTRFLDSNSSSTITLYGATENVITVGAYNDKTNSMWIGSSKGPMKAKVNTKPDIVAPGVDIIGPYMENTYIKATGTGVSSSLTVGVLALIMEYLSKQSPYYINTLFTKVLKTYLMLGATRNNIYIFPNDSQGYGVLNVQRTLEAIANKL